MPIINQTSLLLHCCWFNFATKVKLPHQCYFCMTITPKQTQILFCCWKLLFEHSTNGVSLAWDYLLLNQCRWGECFRLCNGILRWRLTSTNVNVVIPSFFFLPPHAWYMPGLQIIYQHLSHPVTQQKLLSVLPTVPVLLIHPCFQDNKVAVKLTHLSLGCIIPSRGFTLANQTPSEIEWNNFTQV